MRAAATAVAATLLLGSPAAAAPKDGTAGAPKGEKPDTPRDGKRKGKKRLRPPGPVVIRTATVSLPPKVLGTAIATCPGRTRAVGGGFLGEPGGAEQTLVTESYRGDPRSWVVRGIRANPLITTAGSLTATVQCRRRAPRLRPVSAAATLPAAAQPGAVINGEATATCLGRRKRALAGGFVAAWNPETTLGALPQESRRIAKGKSWRFGAAHGNQVPHQITVIAYCGRGATRVRQGTAALAGDLAENSTTASGCARPRRPVAGGFLTSPASLASGGDIVYVLGSRPQSGAWVSSGLHAGPFSTGTLRSFLYCG